MEIDTELVREIMHAAGEYSAMTVDPTIYKFKEIDTSDLKIVKDKPSNRGDYLFDALCLSTYYIPRTLYDIVYNRGMDIEMFLEYRKSGYFERNVDDVIEYIFNRLKIPFPKEISIWLKLN